MKKIAPHEILPLVKAINRLISYQEDKYNQERDLPTKCISRA